MTLPADETRKLFIASVETMLNRFKEIDKRYPLDEDGRSHQTWRELLHWYAHREVNPKF